VGGASPRNGWQRVRGGDAAAGGFGGVGRRAGGRGAAPGCVPPAISKRGRPRASRRRAGGRGAGGWGGGASPCAGRAPLGKTPRPGGSARGPSTAGQFCKGKAVAAPRRRGGGRGLTAGHPARGLSSGPGCRRRHARARGARAAPGASGRRRRGARGRAAANGSAGHGGRGGGDGLYKGRVRPLGQGGRELRWALALRL
jgi:hypothetical protein